LRSKCAPPVSPALADSPAQGTCDRIPGTVPCDHGRETRTMTSKPNADFSDSFYSPAIRTGMGEALRDRSPPTGPLPERLLKLLRALDQPKAVMPAPRRKAEKQQGPPKEGLKGRVPDPPGTGSTATDSIGYLATDSAADTSTSTRQVITEPRSTGSTRPRQPSQPTKKSGSDPPSCAPAWRDRQGPHLDAAGRGRTADASGSTNSDHL
jgi:hypothetical protein